ncbi:MAG: DUF192 domain-containing protein [Rhizomicrobium sp.]|nr:DUF192 domain-containing protein [Rhizomicrobium sp.]
MRALLASLITLFVLCACSPGQDKPQTGLAKAQIVIDTNKGPATFDVEMAVDNAARAKGLMFRTELGSHEGMLFDFGKEEFRAFWMKNTVISLDMLFIKADGTVSTIAENTIPYSETPVPSSEPVQAVLELKGGAARQLGIAPGAKVHARIFHNAP